MNVAAIRIVGLALLISQSADARPHRVARAEGNADLHAMQYLYGSAEAAAATRQTWRALTAYVAAGVRNRPVDSVVLTEGATLTKPRFEPCAAKPLAVVFDVDETVLLNEGFEYDTLVGAAGRPFPPRWRRWERGGATRVTPTPGAADALKALRAMGVTVVFNTNRDADLAAKTETALDHAGLGPAKHGDTLFLKGDDDSGDRKDARRARIAAHFCVIAMAGDQLGDFSDRFNEPVETGRRRDRAGGEAVAGLWGNGWFVMPNPVYGTALQGGADDIFPNDKQWRDPGPAALKEQQ